MVRFVQKEHREITMEYVNRPAASARRDAPQSCHAEDRDTAAVPVSAETLVRISVVVTPRFLPSGRNLYRLVAVGFGLLCILQAALNISLRLALYNRTPDVATSCQNLTEEPEELKSKLVNFNHYFQEGWVYFHPNFYYISFIKKSWQESRDDCLQRGADLVVINSKEEQDFTRNFHKLLWIGLTDRETKGTWRWVDGTPLTQSFWSPGEPNGYVGKNEDCVELKSYEMENSWNDIPCEDQNFWICEKMVAL